MTKKLNSLPHKNVQLQDSFWMERVDQLRKVILPYQWKALNDEVPGAAKSGAIRNFQIAAGEAEGEFHGYWFQDTDVYKWLEAAGYSLMQHPDPELEKRADGAIDLIGRAQQPDGYLNTYFTVAQPGKRWTNLTHMHELYTAGHFFEGAVAYYEATGKKKVLEIACKFADYIDSVFGYGEGQLRGYDGHEEIELALVKLYHATGERKYLELSKFFIDERGRQPLFFKGEMEARGDNPTEYDHQYSQSHLPVREQKDAVGHAVRAVYLYSGMTDVAGETGDRGLFDVCKTLWKSVTQRQMYVTGGIGSIGWGEAFSFDYDLPNDYAYTETCAAIGLFFWAYRMLQIEPSSDYSDVMERALYNGILSGMSADGTKYFYVNPLEVWPEACNHRRDKRHVKPVRQGWYGCACCPPNIARLLGSLNQYIYSNNDQELYVHLYIGSKVELELAGHPVRIVQSGDAPWGGVVKLSISVNRPARFGIVLRIPCWTRGASLKINDEFFEAEPENGYAKINRVWNDGDQIELTMPMKVQRLHANPNVRANAGKVALQRGPFIYCMEETDNGSMLASVSLPSVTNLEANHKPDVLGGVTVVTADAIRHDAAGWNEGAPIYRPTPSERVPLKLKAIPYYAWCNREPGEMQVWIREC